MDSWKRLINKEVGYYMQTPNNSNLQFPLTFQVIRSLLYMHVLLENVENKGSTWTDVDPHNKNTNASDEYLKINPTTKLCYE